MGNYYANIGNSTGQRDPVDRYETPTSVTEALLRRMALPKGTLVREPACGTGRIARVLRDSGMRVHATDLLEDGEDFLEDRGAYDAVITNPPYKDGLAEAFAVKALRVSLGPVALLVRTGFLSGGRRHSRLLGPVPPSHLLFSTKRIKFYRADGTRIPGQAHDHVWVIWNGPSHMRTFDWIPAEELYDA